MKELKFDFKNTYTCQSCDCWFSTYNNHLIFVGEKPICSQKCEIRVYFRIFMQYDYIYLSYLIKDFNLGKGDILTKQEMALRLSNHFQSINLHLNKGVNGRFS